MVGLQTAHRYGNATMLASDFVLGIGNRWANRHTGGLDIYRARPQVRARRHRADADRPGLRARLRHRVRRQGRAGAVRRRGPRAPATPARCPTARAWAARLRRAQAHDAAQDPLRQRADQAAAGVRGDEPGLRPGDPLRHHHRAVADRRGPVPARLPAAPLDQRRAGRAAGLDAAGGARGVRRRPGCHRGRALRRLRLPVHDRGAGRRGAVQPAVHPRRWSTTPTSA